MPDNNRNNNNRNDIDDFFAQFDEPGAGHSRTGSRTARRSEHSRSERNRSSHSRAANQKTGSRKKQRNSSSSLSVKNGAAAVSRPKSTVLKILVMFILAAVMAVGIYTGILFLKAPSVNTDDIYSTLSQRSIMYDSEGNEIENLYFSDGNRTIVKYDSIPEDMVNAVVSIEDKKFFAFGGASSHDIQDGILDYNDENWREQARTLEKNGKYMYRIKELTWWEEELPTDKEMQHGLDVLKENNNIVDYIITHRSRNIQTKTS